MPQLQLGMTACAGLRRLVVVRPTRQVGPGDVGRLGPGNTEDRRWPAARRVRRTSRAFGAAVTAAGSGGVQGEGRLFGGRAFEPVVVVASEEDLLVAAEAGIVGEGADVDQEPACWVVAGA